MDAIDLFKGWTPEAINSLVSLCRGKSGRGNWKKDKTPREVKEIINRRGKGIKEHYSNLSEEEKKLWTQRSFHSPDAVKKSFETHEKSRGIYAGRQSESIKKTLANLTPKEMETKMRSSCLSPDSLRKRGKTSKKVWDSYTLEERGARVLKSRQASQKRPTMPERFLDTYLRKTFPGKLVYNGDGSQNISIGSRIPDFVEPDGGKKVISVMGGMGVIHFWDDEGAEVDHYKRFGYNCLVLWEWDIYSMDSPVKERIRRFLDAS